MNPNHASVAVVSRPTGIRVAALGEVLLRLSPPAAERLLQSADLEAALGGAEANVAVSLACLGNSATMLTALPDSALGRGALAELRRHGIDVSHIALRPGSRMGLYFTEGGLGLRPIEVLYDRADSAFAQSDSTTFDWRVALAGADWLHVSGVTPALGPASARLALDALSAASSLGVRVSFDCNYRATLWQRWGGDAAAILRECASQATLLFADARALALLLDRDARGSDPASGTAFEPLTRQAFEAWPALQLIAATQRIEHSADHHELGGLLATRQQSFRSRMRVLQQTVGRIGSGDAFAAALLHALGRGFDAAIALEFGAAAACLKHSYPGDANLASHAEVEALLRDGGFGVRR